jgi:hypothetical protein
LGWQPCSSSRIFWAPLRDQAPFPCALRRVFFAADSTWEVRQGISVKPGFNLNGSLQLRARRFGDRPVIEHQRIDPAFAFAREAPRHHPRGGGTRTVGKQGGAACAFPAALFECQKELGGIAYLGTSTGASQRDPSAFFKLAPLACELVTAFFRGDRTGAMANNTARRYWPSRRHSRPQPSACASRRAKVGPDRIISEKR